eukprot:jgi/Psemu1/37607/gm1.37607_g
MAHDQQENPNQDNEADVPILDLFPSFDQALVATFLHDSFDVPKESHSTLCEALINSQYRTWSDFLFIENIDDLAYQDSGTRIPLTRHVQLKLQRFVDFGQRLTEQGLDWEEQKHYTKKAFKDYCQGIVKARRASTADGERLTKPIAQLKYESWIRKPRAETTFPVLQNDATFEHWLVQFKAQLDANGINPTTFLDPYWPDHVLTGYTKALHEEQCAFFWTLLRHVFQGDFSSSCVLYHQGTRDGRLAYFDFVKLHNPVSPPAMPTTAPESTHAPGHSTHSALAVHNSPPTTACKTADHPTVDNRRLPHILKPSPTRHGSKHEAFQITLWSATSSKPPPKFCSPMLTPMAPFRLFIPCAANWTTPCPGHNLLSQLCNDAAGFHLPQSGSSPTAYYFPSESGLLRV